jgi:hypothetical protein
MEGTALLALQGRIDSLDLKMFVTAVLIQRETGGNLSEVLGNIGTLMRERAALKADIETLTAESKMSARILSLLPVVVFVLINLINANFMKPMLSSPTGLYVFVAAGFMVMAGYYTMMKIADIDRGQSRAHSADRSAARDRAAVIVGGGACRECAAPCSAPSRRCRRGDGRLSAPSCGRFATAGRAAFASGSSIRSRADGDDAAFRRS